MAIMDHQTQNVLPKCEDDIGYVFTPREPMVDIENEPHLIFQWWKMKK